MWDLAGKLAGQPVWRLLGPDAPVEPLAYVTVYHGPAPVDSTWARCREALDWILAHGYQAAKVEATPDNAPEDRDVLTLADSARQHVGGSFTLLLDAGYRWRTFAEAATVIRELDRYGFRLLEAPFPPERLADYEALAGESSTPVGAGDILTSVPEYLPLLERGRVSAVQAGAPRTGLSGMRELGIRAHEAGCELIPWGWVATTLSTAANLHHAVVHPNVPLVEYAPPALYPGARIRGHLSGPEPTVVEGRFQVPRSPGLGVEVDSEWLTRFGPSVSVPPRPRR